MKDKDFWFVYFILHQTCNIFALEKWPRKTFDLVLWHVFGFHKESKYIKKYNSDFMASTYDINKKCYHLFTKSPIFYQ